MKRKADIQANGMTGDSRKKERKEEDYRQPET